MRETHVERIPELAALWEDQGKIWYFHMLTPDCALNQQDVKYALVMGNSTDSDTWVVYSNQELVKLGQALVRMLHGDAAINVEAAASSPARLGLASILKQLDRLNATGQRWHHHLLFSDCVFNNHPGIWTILIEQVDEDGMMNINLLSEEEPVDDLPQIEVSYYGQADPDF